MYLGKLGDIGNLKRKR